MTVLTFMDAIVTWPLHNDPCAVFEHEMRRLKALYWPDPGDDELRELLAETEAALHALDRGGAA